MRYITGAGAWIFDFLAEDVVLVVGIIVAVVVTLLVVHVTPPSSHGGAGFVLWGVVVLAIAVSLARAVSTRKA